MAGFESSIVMRRAYFRVITSIFAPKTPENYLRTNLRTADFLEKRNP